jgi:hypothetical protein
MSYFADLTAHTYTEKEEEELAILNVGWLDAAYPFEKGRAPGRVSRCPARSLRDAYHSSSRLPPLSVLSRWHAGLEILGAHRERPDSCSRPR